MPTNCRASVGVLYPSFQPASIWSRKGCMWLMRACGGCQSLEGYMLVHVPEDAAPGSVFKAKTPSGTVWAFKVPESLPKDRCHYVQRVRADASARASACARVRQSSGGVWRDGGRVKTWLAHVTSALVARGVSRAESSSSTCPTSRRARRAQRCRWSKRALLNANEGHKSRRRALLTCSFFRRPSACSSTTGSRS